MKGSLVMGAVGLLLGAIWAVTASVNDGGTSAALGDSSDGKGTIPSGYTCVENGTRLDARRVCDGVPDCGRLADDETSCIGSKQELPCRDLAGGAPLFTCLGGGECLPLAYFCDGYVDCPLQEDELHCDRQYIPGCSFGVLQVTCNDVTLEANYQQLLPGNVRFVSLDGVTAPQNSSQGLESLVPPTRFPYVISLYLMNNNLTQLHLGPVNSLKYLRSLHVSRNRIRTLRGDAFSASPNLVLLELPNNGIRQIEPGAFQGMTSLVELNITHNQIVVLQVDTFQNMHNLGTIKMSHNHISDLEPDIFRDVSNITYLSMSYNRMRTLKRGTFRGLRGLLSLDLEHVPIRYIERGALEGLQGLESLQLSHNALEFINPETFEDLTSLQHLSIMGNSIPSLQRGSFRGLRNVTSLNLVNDNISQVEPGAFEGLENLLFLDLGNNTLTDLRSGTFSGMPNLQILWMVNVPITSIEPGAFQGLSKVVSLNILHADLLSPTVGLLDGLDSLTTLSTTDHRLCCLLDPERNVSCRGPSESFANCQRLMPNGVLRVAIWVLGTSAVIGNAVVIYQRTVSKGRREATVQSVLIAHLAASDSLMGLYMLAIGSADLHFGRDYFLYAEAWRSGAWCKAIGFASMLSSEASVFLVTLISLDRFVSIAFPFSRFRLEARYVRLAVGLMWLVAFALSLAGTIMADSKPALYGLSDVCVGLPLITTPVNHTATWSFSRETGVFDHQEVTVSTRPAWAFSVFLYLGLNLLCFLVVLLCYLLIFAIVRRSSRSVGRQGQMAGKRTGNGGQARTSSHHSASYSREVKLASRVALVVGTDFLCWMPIIVMGILTQSGALNVPEELYAWTVVFILPINSSLNPYLYTIAELCAKSRKKSRKAAQCVRMTFTLPRITENDRMANSAVDTDVRT